MKKVGKNYEKAFYVKIVKGDRYRERITIECVYVIEYNVY